MLPTRGRASFHGLGQNNGRLRIDLLEERRLLAADIESDLVGFWRLDEPSIGQIVSDSSGLGNHGSHVSLASPELPSSDVAIIEGDQSRSLSFDRRGGYVAIPAGQAIDFGGGFTQSVWIKPQPESTEFHGVLGYDQQDTRTRGPGIWIVDRTRVHAGFGDGANWNSVITQPVLTSNEWNHVATTFDGADYRVYVNGAEVLDTSAYAGRSPVAIPQFYIGRSDNFFDGRIDHVRVYTRALSAEDVVALADEGSAGDPPSPPAPVDGLIAHWKLDEATIGSRVVDETGRGNEGFHVNIAVPQGPSTDVAVDEGDSSRSLLVDGRNDHISITAANLALAAGHFTQAVWIKPTANNPGFNGVLGFENGLARRAPSIWVLDNTRVHAGFGDGTSWNSLVTDSELTIGEWNHVAVTYDGEFYRVYVDGSEVGFVGGFTGQAPLPITTFHIGRVDNSFEGGIDDVRFYNRALAASQIEVLADLDSPPPPPPVEDGLVGHWRLDEDTLGVPVVEETGLSQAGVARNFAAPHGPSEEVALSGGVSEPRSLSFDGVDDFVQIAESPALDLSGGHFTQSVWIRPDLLDSGFHGVLGHQTTVERRAPGIWVVDRTRIHAGFGDGTSWGALVTGEVLEPNAWNHVVATYDGHDYRIYVGGELVHSVDYLAGRTPFPSTELDIGRVDNHFRGLIDDVRIYDRALDRDEVAQLFSSSSDRYEVQTLTTGGEIEHRFLHNGFHFGTLLELSEGDLAFRPHPDRTDPNGFGSSYRITPFLSGFTSGQSSVDFEVTTAGIDVHANGVINANTEIGSWTWSMFFTYNSVREEVLGAGGLTAALVQPLSSLAGDLNLYRIASNYLVGVPLQPSGSGNTGDMRAVVVDYGDNAIPDFTWIPSDGTTFPTDASPFLSVDVLGDTNVVDTEALGEGFQIAIARKPTISLSLSSRDSAAILSFGAVFDEAEAQNFAADNVGVVGLVLESSTTNRLFDIDLSFSSVPPGASAEGMGRRRSHDEALDRLMNDPATLGSVAEPMHPGPSDLHAAGTLGNPVANATLGAATLPVSQVAGSMAQQQMTVASLELPRVQAVRDGRAGNRVTVAGSAVVNYPFPGGLDAQPREIAFELLGDDLERNTDKQNNFQAQKDISTRL